MVQHLWKLTKLDPNIIDGHIVVGSAFEELSKFNKQIFKCSFLPETVSQSIID